MPEYVSTIWSPLAYPTPTHSIYTMKPHNSNIIPIKEHLQLHASHIRHNSQHPIHPLLYSTQQATLRFKKQTTFNNTHYTTYINTNPNPHKQRTNQNKPETHTHHHSQETENTTKLQTSYHWTHITLKQHSPEQPVVPGGTSEQTCTTLLSYLNKIDKGKHPSPFAKQNHTQYTYSTAPK